MIDKEDTSEDQQTGINEENEVENPRCFHEMDNNRKGTQVSTALFDVI